MTHRPKVPKEQRSFADHGAEPSQPAVADVNLDPPNGFGNLRHNLTNQWKVQDG